MYKVIFIYFVILVRSTKIILVVINYIILTKYNKIFIIFLILM
jgi:hypothetical protein